jgi:hypothetical protein
MGHVGVSLSRYLVGMSNTIHSDGAFGASVPLGISIYTKRRGARVLNLVRPYLLVGGTRYLYVFWCSSRYGRTRSTAVRCKVHDGPTKFSTSSTRYSHICGSTSDGVHVLLNLVLVLLNLVSSCCVLLNI